MPKPAPACNGLGWSADIWIFCVFGSLFPGQLARPSSNRRWHAIEPLTRSGIQEVQECPGPCANCLSDLVPFLTGPPK
jgi:hypothetical protein